MRASLRRPGWALAGASSTTWRDVIVRVGRLLLGLGVLFVLVRGLAGMAEAQRPALDRRGTEGAQTASGAWPDDEAAAFAFQFAPAYLTHASAEDAGVYARRVEAFAS